MDPWNSNFSLLSAKLAKFYIFKKNIIPTFIKLKVSTFLILLFNYGIKTMQNQNKVVTYNSVIFGLWDSSSPINPSFIMQNNPSF